MRLANLVVFAFRYLRITDDLGGKRWEGVAGITWSAEQQRNGICFPGVLVLSNSKDYSAI